MENSATMAIISAVILLMITAGGIVLQIWLSRRESRWPGLFLPALCFLFSLFGVASVARVSSGSVGEGATKAYVTDQWGQTREYAIDETSSSVHMSKPDISETVVTVVYVLLLCNIPTALTLVIYCACRGKRRKKKALDKMSAQDL